MGGSTVHTHIENEVCQRYRQLGGKLVDLTTDKSSCGVDLLGIVVLTSQLRYV